MSPQPLDRSAEGPPARRAEIARGTDAPAPDRPDVAVQVPKVGLPQGGGAIRGIGEKFRANAATGTATMSVPIELSPGRSGFGPRLALGYDSGSGNGPFGLGWSLSLPQVSRKTDKGLPRYLDAQASDVFVLSGAEDLVPASAPDQHRTLGDASYLVRCFRPRIEGLFARIERWTRSDGVFDVFWRSIDKDNVSTWYGRSPTSRITDPNDASHVFAWLVCESVDDKGNAIVYEHVGEDDAGVDPADPAEPRRQASAQRYLKRIRYGNRRSRLAAAATEPEDFLFEVVFDHDEDHLREQGDSPAGHARVEAARDAIDPRRRWALRPDAFSQHRAGFEVRTRRLCRRVLMFHLFDDSLLAQPPARAGALHPTGCLVSATEFTYTQEEHSGLSLMRSVTRSGYRWNADDAAYWKAAWPALEFEYSQATLSSTVCELDAASLENLPAGLDGTQFQWVDLDGEGVSGILTRRGQAWHYKPNLGARSLAPQSAEPAFVAAFGPSRCVAEVPATAGARSQWLDLAGDGRLSLTDFSGPLPGYVKRGTGAGWAAFAPFTSLPRLDWNDPNLRFVDLTGDGRADLLVTGDDVFRWHPSLGETGFGPAERVDTGADEDAGPRLVFADGEQSLYLADMSGDGLADLVRIRNGAVCYWPNLGHGRFGAKLTMRDSPCFDTPDLFDHRRIRLADIDGSGCTDIVYLASDGPRLYFNRSGNGWSCAVRLAGFAPIDDLASVSALDLLGTGTTCLVWSSSLAGDAGRALRYVDLMGGVKPHLLTRSANHLGAETRVHYLPSTHFHLRDQQAGRPWITRLPFPVQVVACVETLDLVSHNRFCTRYAYHHGHYDGVEREFRGFGMVEQWDTEQIAALGDTTDIPALPQASAWQNLQADSQVPPVYTKSWFHTGAYLGREHISNHFAGRLAQHDIDTYYREPGLGDDAAAALLLPDTVLPEGLDLDEAREACRALKGSLLRQEVYALDGTLHEPHPYTVTEQNFGIECLQARGSRPHAVFFVHAREAVTLHFERHVHCAPGTSDPRIAHTMTLAVDAFGNVTKSAAIAYGRRADDTDARLLPEDRACQRRVHLTLTESSFTVPVERDEAHRNPLPAESGTWELRRPVADVSVAGPTTLVRFDELRRWAAQAADGQHDVPSEDLAFESASRAAGADPALATHFFRRLIDRTRTLYRPDDCGVRAGDADALLPLHQMEPRALVGETYRLALTPGLIDRAFGPHAAEVGAALLCDRGPEGGGYVDLDGDACAWLPSGRSFVSPQSADDAAAELAWACEHFFSPSRYRDAFGHATEVRFDGLDLLIAGTTDALGNSVAVLAHDYRVLQACILSDANGNRSQVAFDLMGRVAGHARMGKPGEPVGDSLDGFEPDPADADVQVLLADPLGQAASMLGRASMRWVDDPFAFDRSQHLAQPQPAVVVSIARETHDADLTPDTPSRLQLGFSYGDGLGREIQKKVQAGPDRSAAPATPRWIGSGWTVFDNKGQPVRRYEPFFSDTHGFEFGLKQGVSVVLFYDPVGRVVATLHPDHRYEKVVFGPWRQLSFDANDTTLGPASVGAAPFDPKDDPDVGAQFKRLPAADYLPTWHALRTDPAQAAEAALRWPDPRVREAERQAADKAAAHAGTPATSFFDTMGRAFVAWTHNRVVCPNHALDGTESHDATRFELDIQGRVLAVRDAVVQAGDALGRIVVRHDHDLLGHRLHQASMEAGERWTLVDVSGRPIRAWDSRGHVFTTTYDALRRPIGKRVRGTTAESDPRTLNQELRVEQTEYGEAHVDAMALNLRTRIYRQFDSAGVVTHAGIDPNTQQWRAYDFKGNLLRSTRQLASDYQAIPDWSQPPALDDEVFAASTRFDALDRPIQTVAARSSLPRAKRHIVQPVYDEGGLLDRIDVWLDRAAEPVALLDATDEPPSPAGVVRIDHNARGQRERIDHANGARTDHGYDPLTFRLVHLLTRRNASAFPDDDPHPPLDAWPGSQIQNLRYSFDANGNITHILDDAQQTIWFKQQRVEPSNDYTYDALGRLIEATGREHLGQGGASIPHSYNDAGRTGQCTANGSGRFAPNDGQAMGRYVERYVYDAVGNVLEMQHRGGDALPGWTRTYRYAETSLIEDGSGGLPPKTGNRLSATTLDPDGAHPMLEPYLHDVHGNLLGMPQLQFLQWDHADRLRASQRQKVNGEDADGQAHQGERTFYVYDATGQRVRKVTELAGGHVVEERIYLGGFEIFRRHRGPITADSARFERETLHVMDGEQRIALVETRTLDTAGDDMSPAQLIRYALGNHLGSACIELDEAAQIISYEEYTPYGSTSYQAVRSATEAAKRYRFTGKERDEETGLYYHGARYFAPWLGRWTSCDPKGISDRLSLYVFTRASPVSMIDRMGSQTTSSGDAGVPRRDMPRVAPRVSLPAVPDLSSVRIATPPMPDLSEIQLELSSIQSLPEAVSAKNWPAISEKAKDFDRTMESHWVKEWEYGGGLDFNCISASRMMMMRSEGLLDPDVSMGTLVEGLQARGVKTDGPLGRMSAARFNQILPLMPRGASGSGESDKRISLVTMNIEQAKAHMQGGHMVIAWVDDLLWGRKGHVVAIYFNPESKRYMVLDPLKDKASHEADPIDLSATYYEFGRRIPEGTVLQGFKIEDAKTSPASNRSDLKSKAK